MSVMTEGRIERHGVLPRGAVLRAAGSSRPGRDAQAGVRPLDVIAVVSVVVLCASWGLQQVAVKLALAELPPLTQTALRAAIAATLVAAWSVVRGRSLIERDGTLKPGLVAGFLFAVEFILIYVALQWTSASRVVLFLYTAPFFVALGSIWLLPHERLSLVQWLGLACSFLGIALALGVAVPSASLWSLVGDLAVVLAGALWAATTLLIKTSRLRQASPEKVLLYQLVVSVVICGLGAAFLGERVGFPVSMPVLGALAYQAIWVAGVTYLVWFWLVRRHPAGQLSAFTFLAPVFGIAAGHLILAEPLTSTFVAAAALVALGLVLVNRPSRHGPDQVRQEQR
jgi:drug/metabolite transporter (DMT)-like permease